MPIICQVSWKQTNKRIQDSFFLWQRYLTEKRCPEEVNAITGWLAGEVGMVQGSHETMNTQSPFAPCSVMDNRYWWQGFYHLAIKKSAWAIWEWHSSWWKKTQVISEQLYVVIESVHQRQDSWLIKGLLCNTANSDIKWTGFLTLRSSQFHFQPPAPDYITLPFQCRPRERILLLMRNLAKLQAIQRKPMQFQACRIPFNFMSI